MADLLTVANLLTLLMLVLQQAVLGFDNLLYISLESRRAPKERQPCVRKFFIAVLVINEIVQGHYHRKILAEQARRQAGSDSHA